MKNLSFRLAVLSAIISVSSSIFAGPEQDFTAAYEAGKPLTAEAEYLKLMKSGAAGSAAIHLRAAEVAAALGKSTFEKDRLMVYLRTEKGWNADVERACWKLSKAGAGVEYYERLAANVKPSKSLWTVGEGMLGQLCDAGRRPEILRLSRLLLEKFPEPGRRSAVLYRLFYAMNVQTVDFSEKELVDMLFATPDIGENEWLLNIVSGARARAFPLGWTVLYAAKNGTMRDDYLSDRGINPLTHDSVLKSTNATTIAQRDAAVAALKKLKPLCFDGKHPWAARQYFRATALCYPKQFFSSVSTNGQVAGACALYKELMAQPQYKTDPNYAYYVHDVRNEAMRLGRFTPAEVAALVDANPETFDINTVCTRSSLGAVGDAAAKDDSVAPIQKLAAKFPKQADAIYRNNFYRYVYLKKGQGDVAGAKRIFIDIVRNDANFGWAILEWMIDGCQAMRVADKVELFKSGYVLTGFNGAWKEFRKRAAANAKDGFFADPAVKAFGATIKDDALSGDPLLKARQMLGRAKTHAERHAAAEAFVKAFPTKLGAAKSERDNALAKDFFVAYWHGINRGTTPEDTAKWLKAFLPKFAKDVIHGGWVEEFLRKAADGALWRQYHDARIAAGASYDILSGMVVPKNSEKVDKPYAGIDMKKMSAAAAYNHFSWSWDNLKDGPDKTALYWNFVFSRPFGEHTDDAARRILDLAYALSFPKEKEYDQAFLAKFPLDEATKAMFAKPYLPWADRIGTLFALACRAGKYDDWFKRYSAWLDSRDVQDRALGYIGHSVAQFLAPPDEKHDRAWWRYKHDNKAYAAILREKVLPALKAIPSARAPIVDFNNSTFWEALRWNRDYWLKPETKDEANAKLVEDIYAEMVRLVLAGAWTSEGLTCETTAWHQELERALEKGAAPRVARLARVTARSVATYYLGDQRVKNVLVQLKEKNPEALYLYVDAIAHDQPAWLVSLAAKYRAEVASSLPGIYPVAENDPAYPLYVAAAELQRKNPERAWQILQDPRLVSVFEREAVKLPPEFAVWGVEQLRLARGEKDALLVKARQIASAVLAQEGKVSPEVAAGMILSRAEGFRDQQNFEAAKLEYQSIRDNPVYHATKYGKRAMFRAMDLQIAMGNTAGVEGLLEYWLSQNDREVQAEAHYFLARIAFDRKDYDECSKQLRQVFAINYTHTEGRFLHGQWKLATNSEVDDTDVLVGDLAERSLIRPGNQLTVTVQDSNLSVAGGGASIPVIVRSTPNGDVERINLYPTSRAPSNFKGLIEVQLGKPCPSNRVLEVTGKDVVSYEIDPAFLKARGLPLNQPKKLRVIDDAKLAIGAGAPRAEEAKTEKGVRDLLEGDASVESGNLAQKLRPGNPLYVVVRDRDCSHGGAADKVFVTIETTSGDTLSDFPLQEEKPFTGVFRGKVETTLPPPRAFASDTAAGMNPGDVINSGKTAGWKSLSDGQPGKWFEVDTMGSHLFSEISLAMPAAADVKVLKLVGRMGSKVMTLGQLPAAAEASKLALRLQRQFDNAPQRSLAQLRAFCQTGRASKRVAVTNVQFRALNRNNNWQTAFFSGPCCLPDGLGSLRLRLRAVSAKKDALKNLWVGIAVDGEEVFSGQGCKLQDALVTADVTDGCHRLEVAAVAFSPNDEFDLLYEPIGQEPGPIPADWFDAERHSALKDFVKDLAEVKKTEGGFTATFAKPVRLRSFRWEFSDVKSPDIAVTRLTAKNEKGETVLPVASDFSDARSNRTLEVAPGDRIMVKYTDERTSSGEQKVLERAMASSFNDAHVRFVFEEADEHGSVRAYDAFRFQPGDALVLAVADPDCDVTDEADKITVTLKNAAGKSYTKRLTEYWPKWMGYHEDSYGMHSGVFMGVLRTCPEGDTNAPPNVLRVAADDLLTVSYDDRENTDPGVPCTRTAKIFAARPAEPTLTLFHIRKTQEPDRSPDAKAQLARIRRRPGNENVDTIWRDVLVGEPMDAAEVATTNPIPVNVAAGAIPVRVNDRSRARYSCSKVWIEAVAHSELKRAAVEGRQPEKVRVPLVLGGSLSPIRLAKGDESEREARAAGTFNGLVRLSLGPVDPNIEVPEDAPPLLCVTGSDLVDITVLGEDGKSVLSRTVKLVSDATISLTDSSFAAARDAAHVGESFFVKVDDADCDKSEEPDQVRIKVVSSKTGLSRPLTLVETMPHSGVFTGRLRPVMFAPGETIPSVSTGGVASAHEILTEDRFSVGYGDSVIFCYDDALTLPGTPARTLSATGTVFRGSNGSVRVFSKRFADRDAAVLVQFRLAECLFEQAKEHRKLKQAEKSAEAIAEGKFILEEALKNFPDSTHVVEGEFLLANLYQELATEQKDAGEKEKSIPLYQEALSRFSQILGTWPEGDFAARSQYHKAYCLEMLEDYGRASEEYVKMTYLYPESELVGDATIRLATYYYTKEKRFDIAGHIYRNFQHRFPQHDKAARSLFMAGSCYIKQAETIAADIEARRVKKEPIPNGYASKIGDFYRDASKTFETLVDTYRDSDPKLRAQTLYWAGDVCIRRGDYPKAYQHLKRTVFEFPETEWARRARGLLLQEDAKFRDFE